jgi:hypothetical protein
LRHAPTPGVYGDIDPGKMAGCNARDLVASFYDGPMKPADFRYEYK